MVNLSDPEAFEEKPPSAQPVSTLQDNPLAPPLDHGKDAWLFLAACFVMEALVWGFAFTYGVFQDYYSTLPIFQNSNSIAIIGTCAMGIMYLDLPIIFTLYRQYPTLQRTGCALGVLLMCLSLGLSSLSTTVPHLILTQGIFYAIGGSIAYSPCILLMEDWFDQRKGLAFGVMWAGTGLGGAILPLVMQRLLDLYGFRITLRAFAITLFVLTAPLVYFVKPRTPIPNPTPRGGVSLPNLRFLFSPTFLLFQAFNTIEALGYFLPSLYLPTYARAIGGASGTLEALTVILLNVASVAGCVCMGAIIDHLDVTTCILISATGSTIGVFLLWGFSVSLPPLFIFAVVYGLFAGSYTSTWPGVMRDVVKNESSADSSIVFACLAAGRGIGNTVSGPLSEALLTGMPWTGKVGYGYGSGYGTLIIFTGVTGVLGGGSYLVRRMGWL
ncbi:MFS general substrate transporter [Aspergillus sclerotiicarbonarius CBS 121057]|uniref:MFS general substrate transporter n=1 Tax=Aspergillus sclerotiicarbonarius (strain CBS 121057 / IBT 28362) TaxID=1448318 RepID=A0A319EE99_ASPSB|nr:MFS general substrate transporter [Aspergillus sclerotiicarbonarius CBS 121057]